MMGGTKTVGMEVNFTLITMKKQLAFLGQVTEKRMRIFFRFDEPIFVQIMDILLGDDFMRAKNHYQTNVDIASLVMACSLELDGKEEVLYVMEKCVKED